MGPWFEEYQSPESAQSTHKRKKNFFSTFCFLFQKCYGSQYAKNAKLANHVAANEQCSVLHCVCKTLRICVFSDQRDDQQHKRVLCQVHKHNTVFKQPAASAQSPEAPAQSHCCFVLLFPLDRFENEALVAKHTAKSERH
jgi:hypothetical protein